MVKTATHSQRTKVLELLRSRWMLVDDLRSFLLKVCGVPIQFKVEPEGEYENTLAHLAALGAAIDSGLVHRYMIQALIDKHNKPWLEQRIARLLEDGVIQFAEATITTRHFAAPLTGLHVGDLMRLTHEQLLRMHDGPLCSAGGRIAATHMRSWLKKYEGYRAATPIELVTYLCARPKSSGKIIAYGKVATPKGFCEPRVVVFSSKCERISLFTMPADSFIEEGDSVLLHVQ